VSNDPKLDGRNKRTALILASIAIAFALGAVLRQVLFGH